MLNRFGAHWQVLLSHLILFKFIYPPEPEHIPNSVMQILINRLHCDFQTPSNMGRLCRGPLLSKVQYAIDIDNWGYQDVRLLPLTSSEQ